MPSDVVIFILIFALLWLNSRREIWKHRAKMKDAEIQSLKMRLQCEQEANTILAKQIPNNLIYRVGGAEWPEEID